MRSSQELVLEDPSTLKKFDVSPFAALEVCLSEALTLFRIPSRSEVGVTGGP